MRIVTHQELDAPTRFAWSAIDDATYDGAPDSHGPIGRGRTEFAAVRDLLDQFEERAGEAAYRDYDMDDPIIASVAVGNEDLDPDRGPHPHVWVLSAGSTEVCIVCGVSRPLAQEVA